MSPDLDRVRKKLILGRERIAEEKNWRRGALGDDEKEPGPPYCAGSALWVTWHSEEDRKDETDAIRRLLAAAALPVPDPPDEDAEIDALVDWNDSSDHATVLAAFDKAIADCK